MQTGGHNPAVSQENVTSFREDDPAGSSGCVSANKWTVFFWGGGLLFVSDISDVMQFN